MYKFILAFVLSSLTIFGCSSNSKAEEAKNTSEGSTTPSIVNNEVSNHSPDKDQGQASTIQLTKDGFLNKIMNYEENPNEWNYLGDKPAIIDFYADWCGPCKIAAPVLEELAKEYKDDIYIYKVDTEVERELAGVFGIRSIPSFLFIPEAGKPTMSNGIARTPEETKEMFKQMIDELLLDQSSEGTL